MDIVSKPIQILIGDKPLFIVLEEQRIRMDQLNLDYNVLKREYELLKNSYDSLEREKGQLNNRIAQLNDQISHQQTQIMELFNRGLFQLIFQKSSPNAPNITETEVKLDDK